MPGKPLTSKPLRSCLIAAYDKEGLRPLAECLHKLGVQLYATAGTCAYLRKIGLPAVDLSTLTQYPELLGGRVKTLHPKIFGGLLYRGTEEDQGILEKYDIPRFDMLVVNLYPFGEALRSGAEEAELIEKIDIGGVALLRAGAKNFYEIWVLSDLSQYATAVNWLSKHGASTTLALRRGAALYAFHRSAAYDQQIVGYFNTPAQLPVYMQYIPERHALPYGENPHQRASFYGPLDRSLKRYQGKPLSYNNLIDVDASLGLLRHLGDQQPAFVIVKHGNPCGVGRGTLLERAYHKAYATDSLSAFGGVFATNRCLNEPVAQHMVTHFFEAVLAPSYSPEALMIFSLHKQRRVLQILHSTSTTHISRSALGGILQQEIDLPKHNPKTWEMVTTHKPAAACLEDLRFANAIVTCAGSNAIVLAKNEQLIGCGAGQTSRIDALLIAIEKAKRGGLSLTGSVMASEAFFPFPDCVEVAHKAGIQAIVQPGGSKNDKLSISYCEEHGLPMLLTRVRHFKH